MPLTDTAPTPTTKPNKVDVLREWVRRLRSGDYRQGNGELKTTIGHGVDGYARYCCLGVLGEVYNEQHPDNHVRLEGLSYLTDEVWAACVPNAVSQAEIAAYHRMPRGQRYWARLNDTARQSFSEIADEIEQRLLADTEGNI